MRDQYGLTDIVNQSDDPIFISTDIKNRHGPFRFRVGRHIRLAEHCPGVLERRPACSSTQFEPVLERVRVLPSFRPRLVKLSKFSSTDHVHDFTLCEVRKRKSRGGLRNVKMRRNDDVSHNCYEVVSSQTNLSLYIR